MQFSIFDLARTAVEALSGNWGVKRGDWDVSAVLFNETRSFCLHVDEPGDLCLDYDRPSDEQLPEEFPLSVVVYPMGMFFEAARPEEGLHALAEKIASAVEAAVSGSSVPTSDAEPEGVRAEPDRRTYRVRVRRSEVIQFAIEADSAGDAEARYLADGVKVASWTEPTSILGVALDQQ
ncbi:hypothetical protein OHR86_00040 [Streptomyces sp. NBC_00441]|uniref:hypothetical protein n=1 Tax=Streptomyces sp. NBC_00441 TaxID=2975742 RepID=UPI002E2E4206|nr:hypothetical protein [Streptomyces sp. NBC_00441]